MKRLVVGIAAAMMASAASASGLTDSQKTGMYRHGNWMWSIEKCSGVKRNKRYWFFLKEGGNFDNFSQISALTHGPYFKQGWNYMQEKAITIGHDQACDYAMKTWPAMLWRGKVQ